MRNPGWSCIRQGGMSIHGPIEMPEPSRDGAKESPLEAELTRTDGRHNTFHRLSSQLQNRYASCVHAVRSSPLWTSALSIVLHRCRHTRLSLQKANPFAFHPLPCRIIGFRVDIRSPIEMRTPLHTAPNIDLNNSARMRTSQSGLIVASR